MPGAGERLAGFSRYARTGIPGGLKKIIPPLSPSTISAGSGQNRGNSYNAQGGENPDFP
jgi:hypothetical protein